MTFHTLVTYIADYIAYAGVVVVIVGVLVTIIKLLMYIFTGFDEFKASELRHSLMIYLSIGLDFIIAKDVILTLSLDRGEIDAVAQLALVIVVRFLLSLFVHLEERSLHRQGVKRMPKVKSSPSRKKGTKRRLIA